MTSSLAGAVMVFSCLLALGRLQEPCTAKDTLTTGLWVGHQFAKALIDKSPDYHPKDLLNTSRLYDNIRSLLSLNKTRHMLMDQLSEKERAIFDVVVQDACQWLEKNFTDFVCTEESLERLSLDLEINSILIQTYEVFDDLYSINVNLTVRDEMQEWIKNHIPCDTTGETARDYLDGVHRVFRGIGCSNS